MKNKSMNKILALGVVAAMTAGMLAGCGSSASTTDGAAARNQKLLLILQQAMVKYLPWYGGL